MNKNLNRPNKSNKSSLLNKKRFLIQILKTKRRVVVYLIRRKQIKLAHKINKKLNSNSNNSNNSSKNKKHLHRRKLVNI